MVLSQMVLQRCVSSVGLLPHQGTVRSRIMPLITLYGESSNSSVVDKWIVYHDGSPLYFSSNYLFSSFNDVTCVHYQLHLFTHARSGRTSMSPVSPNQVYLCIIHVMESTGIVAISVSKRLDPLRLTKARIGCRDEGSRRACAHALQGWNEVYWCTKSLRRDNNPKIEIQK